MTSSEPASEDVLRRRLYALLIVVALATTAGRIVTFDNRTLKDRPTPFLSANDRSRWCMIAALGDKGTYVIDDYAFDPETGKRRKGWHTIDMVRHRGADGREHFYSSKPTLMPTILAGVYWLVKQTTGATLLTHPYYVGNIVTLIANLPALVAIAVCVAWWLERLGGSTWARMVAMTCAVCGTLLSTYSITLNNHVHSAAFAIVATTLAVRATDKDRPRWSLSLLAGVCAGMAYANELPALSLVAALGVWFLFREPLAGVFCYLPGVAVIVVAALGTNWLGHQSLQEPYNHRRLGREIAKLPDSVDLEDESKSETNRLAIEQAAKEAEKSLEPQWTLDPNWTLSPGRMPGRWVVFDETNQRRLAVAKSDQGTTLHEWDDWYDYEGTHWTPENMRGVDGAGMIESRATYAFHVLLGHHGVISLSPFWLLAIAGGVTLLRGQDRAAWALAVAGFGLTVLVLGFYLSRPWDDRNYGGVTNGVRWVFWLIPFWLVMSTPAVDWLSKSRWGSALVLVLLAINVFSAAYGPLNPWSHPWLFHYGEQMGWFEYP